MKIFIGADHRGFLLKKDIVALLQRQGYAVIDLGTHDKETSCDYPKVAYELARKVALNPGSRGILACMTGIGHSISANKVRGAYAALCYNKQAAVLSREHNNSNILILGSKFVKRSMIKEIIRAWLKTEFAGGRHLRRFNQIRKIEQKEFK